MTRIAVERAVQVAVSPCRRASLFREDLEQERDRHRMTRALRDPSSLTLKAEEGRRQGEQEGGEKLPRDDASGALTRVAARRRPSGRSARRAQRANAGSLAPR